MTKVMGILNVTPDSFSDGGRWFRHADAIAHGHQLVEQGAEIVDVGGESTRPGTERVVDEAEEIRRVVPVVEALARDGIVVSVDTMRAGVARASIEAGAGIINDVSGGLADTDMLGVVAGADVDFVLMHWRGHSATMQDLATYDDVVADVEREVLAQRDVAVEAGIDASRIILDPGIGFAKTAEHNWELLRHLDRFCALGHRVLVGASRKGFLGQIANDRDTATAVVSAWSALHGAWAVRTHEVPHQLDAIAVAGLLRGSGEACHKLR